MNKKLLIVMILLLPLMSGCSLLSNDKKLNVEDEAKVVPVLDIENVDNIKEVSTEENNTELNKDNSTTIKLTNNSTKKNAMDIFDANKQYIAVVHTSLGDFTINFNKGQTPKTIENFVTLAQKGFYDKTIFHRVIKGFMIQGGDPVGNGTGGPGYKFADESFNDEYVRGAVAMANSGPNTNGSQFFVMHADYPLPKNYTIFGHVVSGMETVDKIAESKVSAGGFGENSTPVVPTMIKSIDVSVK
jgi:cyclophilin family peptidyl-prolyl cis-trans isomerase